MSIGCPFTASCICVNTSPNDATFVLSKTNPTVFVLYLLNLLTALSKRPLERPVIITLHPDLTKASAIA